ncbi:MAG: Rv3235 family protein [Nocardioides sp.]
MNTHATVVPLRVPVPIAETQGTLALALQPRLDPPPLPEGDLRTRRDIDAWAHRFAQAAVEIIGGDRPASQLARWSSSEVYADLERRAQLVARAGAHQPGVGRVQPVRPRVLSVRSCFPRPRCAEVSLHVRYGERSRAVAARFELRRTRGHVRWVCTALEFA